MKATTKQMWEKAIRVVSSARTTQQIEIAKRYIELAKRKANELRYERKN